MSKYTTKISGDAFEVEEDEDSMRRGEPPTMIFISINTMARTERDIVAMIGLLEPVQEFARRARLIVHHVSAAAMLQSDPPDEPVITHPTEEMLEAVADMPDDQVVKLGVCVLGSWPAGRGETVVRTVNGMGAGTRGSARIYRSQYAHDPERRAFSPCTDDVRRFAAVYVEQLLRAAAEARRTNAD